MARKKEELENKNQEETKVEITEEPTETLFSELENIETVESNEFGPIEKENIEIMSLDNKPINEEVIKEPVNIPDKFVKIPKKVEHTKTINIRNRRVYKELGNGYGIYSDDGSIFKI